LAAESVKIVAGNNGRTGAILLLLVANRT
jgi:hypothetical protein